MSQVVEDGDLQPEFLTTDHSIRQVERQEEWLKHDQLANQQTHSPVPL